MIGMQVDGQGRKFYEYKHVVPACGHRRHYECTRCAGAGGEEDIDATCPDCLGEGLLCPPPVERDWDAEGDAQRDRELVP